MHSNLINRIVIIATIMTCGYTNAQNLVTNGNFEAGNSAFTSEYTFVTSNTTEGEYGVVTDPRSWNGFVASFGDHTTGTGSMMVVNGKTDSSPVVWSQEVSVLPNRTYFFSTWAANTFTVAPSRFVFRVNDQTLPPSVVLPAEPAVWQNYTTSWNSETATTAKLEIIFTSTERLGNDSALDDIVFREVSSTPVVIGASQAICLEWDSSIGIDYQVQNSDDLQLWTDIGQPINGTGNTMSYCEKFDRTRKHYRVIGLVQ